MTVLLKVNGLRGREQFAVIAALQAPLLLVLILSAHVGMSLAHVPSQCLRLGILAAADGAHVSLLAGLEVGTRLHRLLCLLSELLLAAALFESEMLLALGATSLGLLFAVGLDLLARLGLADGAARLLLLLSPKRSIFNCRRI